MRKFIGGIFRFFYEYSNCEIKSINKQIASRPIKMFLLFMIVPYIVVKGILCWLYENFVGRYFMKQKLSADRERDFKYILGFVAIVKNEGPYIREWISYHLLKCGNDTVFYIYDNESDDGLRDIISDYIEQNIVKYVYYPGKTMQLRAYEDAIERYSDECRYMAFIDADEFLCTETADLRICVNRIFDRSNNATGIAVNWALFGSSGQETKTDGLVTERFCKRAEDNFWGNEHIKSIANPRFVRKFISCHYPLYKIGCWNVNSKGKRQRGWQNIPVCFDEIRLNHYFGKSREEFITKRSRGWADQIGEYVDFERFDQYDRNEVNDDSMLKFVDDVKYLMG